MSNETELDVSNSFQKLAIDIIDKELRDDFLELTSDQLASILISSLGITAGKAIIKNFSDINHDSYVKFMDLIHDCSIFMWDLNEDKE